MTTNLTTQLAEYAIQSHSLQYTKNDKQMTLLSIIDWLGAAIAGKDEECINLLMKLNSQTAPKGNETIITQKRKTAATEAALINGTMSHVLDFDDIHDFLSLHLCSPIIPAAIAAAEENSSSGLELMDAIVNGMQIPIAISAGIMPEHYNIGRWHATGTLGIFGAAAAAGFLYHLTTTQMCNAFGIAANLCSGIQLNFGTMAKSLCAGMAAKNGLLAAKLAKSGFTGRADIFDTDFLMNISTKKDLDQIKEQIQERLGGSLGINEIRFKYYPCGVPTHSGILNCKKIMSEHPFKPEDVKEIVFEPYPRAIRLVGNMNPQTGLEGKFSIAFTAAAQMVFGKVTMETFTDANVQNPQVVALMKKMKLIPNEEFTYSRGGKVTIYLNNGDQFTNSTYILGHDIDPFESTPDVVTKFKEICNIRIGEEKTEKTLKAIMALETEKDCHELTALLG